MRLTPSTVNPGAKIFITASTRVTHRLDAEFCNVKPKVANRAHLQLSGSTLSVKFQTAITLAIGVGIQSSRSQTFVSTQTTNLRQICPFWVPVQE